MYSRKQVIDLAESLFSISESALDPKARQTLALALFIAYRDGTPAGESGTPLYSVDQKAEYYLAKALCLTPPTSPCGFFLDFLAKITSSRLAIIRVFRLHPVAFFLATTSTGLLFKAFQLSYILEIGFCIALLLEKSLRPQTSANEWWFERIELRRTKQALWDDGFWNTLSNALGWTAVNKRCFSADTARATTWSWNLSGFLGDVGHDIFFARRRLKKTKDTKKSIESFKSLSDEKRKEHPLYDVLSPIIDVNNAQLLNQVLDDFLANCDKEIKAQTFTYKRVTAVAIKILVGMALFYLACYLSLPGVLLGLMHAHPSLIPFLIRMTPDIINDVKYFGSGLVIFAGVICGGLGSRIFFGWSKLGLFISDMSNGHFADWFNKESRNTFWLNFRDNALIPMSSIIVLMLATQFFAVSTVIISACFAMAACAFLMEKRRYFYTSSPPLSIKKVERINKIIECAATDDKLDLKKVLESDPQSLKGELSALRIAAGMDKDSFVTVLKEWTKEEKMRAPSSNEAIKRILQAGKIKPPLLSVRVQSEANLERSESGSGSGSECEGGITPVHSTLEPRRVRGRKTPSTAVAPVVEASTPNVNSPNPRVAGGCANFFTSWLQGSSTQITPSFNLHRRFR